jgi:pyruvate dehydrogenase E2 component (dihydrolipoamide acetyltransferase)
MPRYGWTMTEGKIVEWLKREGDEVKAGEPLLIIESEKTEIEVEAEDSGVLLKIVAPEGTNVPIAQPIAIIGQAGESVPAPTLSKAPDETSVVPDPHKLETTSWERASPRAKMVAQKHKIDLSKIHGTGHDGLIVAEDVINLVRSLEPQNQTMTTSKTLGKKMVLDGRRKIIAQKMALSSRTTAAVTITMEADASDATQQLHKLKEQNLEVTLTDLIAKAVAMALEEHPLLNSIWLDDEILIPNEINLGIAVADREGLVVPVIKNADKKSLREISEARRDIVKRVDEGKLSPDEASGSTFTISNLGMYGVQFFTPIINWPENAIIGVGRITEKAAVINGKILIRSILPLSLSFDHRVIDGAPASIFLTRVKELIEKPALLA